MTINCKIPSFRLPCLKQGDLYFAPIVNSGGNPFVLSRLPHLTEKEAWLLEGHAKEIAKCGGTLAVLLNRTFPSTGSWIRPLYQFNFPIFVDPQKRLHRSLRLLHNLPLRRCESLIFDHHHSLKFRIFHEFNFRGFSTMLTIARTDMLPSNPLPQKLEHVRLSRNEGSRISHRSEGPPGPHEPRPQSVHLQIPEICA